MDGRGTDVSENNMEYSKITSDNDPTKTDATTLLKFPHRRKEISVYKLKEWSILRFQKLLSFNSSDIN